MLAALLLPQCAVQVLAFMLTHICTVIVCLFVCLSVLMTNTNINNRAMGGSVLFQDALASRLTIMGLSQQRLDEFLKAHPAQVTPGVRVCI